MFLLAASQNLTAHFTGNIIFLSTVNDYACVCWTMAFLQEVTEAESPSCALKVHTHQYEHLNHKLDCM